MRLKARAFLGLALLILSSGCAGLFGWDIHAPGRLSKEFSQTVQPVPERIALYLPPEVLHYESREKGGWSADPQTFHVGEALAPMLVEGFQDGFQEFIFLEVEPTPAVLHRYGIPRTAVVRVKEFGNRVTLKGQALTLVTETVILDPDLKPLARFESRGVSDAQKVFSKKGGPEVNLNAAIEQNVFATIQQIREWKP